MKRKQRIHNHLLPIQLSCVFLWLKDPKLYGILQPTLWGISMRFYLDNSPVYISLYHQKRRPINSELNTNFHGEKILVFMTPKAQVTKKEKR